MHNPFSLFDPYRDRLTVGMFVRSDDIRSDAEAAITLNVSHAVGLNQMHGRNVVIVREPSNRTIEADGMITDAPDLALCIRWADCQNFVVYAPAHNILGAIHAGWRGLRDGTIPALFGLLREEFHIDGKDCLVGAGPSLCVQCAEFTDPLKEIHNVPKQFVRGNHVELQAWAMDQILSEGVDPKNFERHPDCTRCNPEKYWTYRGGHREEVKRGHTNMLTCALRAN